MADSEKELQLRINTFLSKYFKVEEEVWSVDHRHRIDLIIVHKTDIDKFYPIGIEIKTIDKKTGSSLGAWLHQAHNYSTNDFVNYGKILVITCPQISGECLAEGMLMHKHDVYASGDLAHQHNVNTFLAQFNIGELQKYQFNNKSYLRIVFNAKLIWDHRKDEFRSNNYIAVCSK